MSWGRKLNRKRRNKVHRHCLTERKRRFLALLKDLRDNHGPFYGLVDMMKALPPVEMAGRTISKPLSFR